MFGLKITPKVWFYLHSWQSYEWFPALETVNSRKRWMV